MEGDQLFLAQTFDVKRAPTDEMLQPLDDLGVADQAAGAAAAHLVPLAHRLGATDGAMGRKDVGRGVGGAAVQHDADDLGDDIPCALQGDGVADSHVLARDLVLIVQGRIAHDDAADGDGVQSRDGGQGAGTADLDVDPLQDGRCLLRRELVGDGPARAARDEAQTLLPVQAIDLVDHPVDVIAQGGAFPLQFAVNADQRLRPLDSLRAGVDAKAPSFQRLQSA